MIIASLTFRNIRQGAVMKPWLQLRTSRASHPRTPARGPPMTG